MSPEKELRGEGDDVRRAGRTARVTIASRIFLPEPAAASFRLAALASALADEGAEVTVVTASVPASMGSGPEHERVRVRRRPVLRDASGYVRGYVPYLSFDVPLFLRLLAGRRPDVVVAEPPPTTGAVVRLVCALRRVPYVYYAADIVSDAAGSTGAPRLVVGIVRALERFALRGASAVLTVTDAVEARASQLGAPRTTIVRHGVDTATFNADVVPLAPEGRGPFAVYAGNASEWHGAEVFLEAWPGVVQEVPGARLVFLGRGSMHGRLAEMAAAMPDGGASVTFLPQQPAAQAARWLRGADVALSSIRPESGYEFAIPTKALAAMAVGTPVLQAGPGPVGQIIERATAGRVVPHASDAVARALVEMLEAPPSDDERLRVAAWAEEHLSVRSTSVIAARSVLGVVGSRLRRRAGEGIRRATHRSRP
ncbi:glycosyltransferase involved in cell wall biosynthesis [Cellulosimicrobium cellulans]|jgi:glycosyltransferase involved in cell wall biosynthesis|uniref:glycosyltransferase family 4 protein n=1 Tax=Cellulosimicrobium cellulans TaxID=1710 RepID=UPI001958A8B0|nr:glycosyltransferase family 4 protein [Cellulosimicrobium cellulans]MBM7820874.1 glycosyltransferase involved in cell wall biosynthesis [Cellulosimicrobium cellulans]